VNDSSLKVPRMEGVHRRENLLAHRDQVVERTAAERIGECAGSRRRRRRASRRPCSSKMASCSPIRKSADVSGHGREYLPAGTKLSKQQLSEINFADVDLKTLRVATSR